MLAITMLFLAASPFSSLEPNEEEDLFLMEQSIVAENDEEEIGEFLFEDDEELSDVGEDEDSDGDTDIKS